MTTLRLVGVGIAVLLAAAAVPVKAGAAIQLQQVLSNLTRPIFVTNARDGSNRLFVVEQAGVIKVLQPGDTVPIVFLDISSQVLSGGEQGLLGLTFHPQFSSTRRFFVDYTRQGDGATVIAEYQVSQTDPNIADPTETVLLVIAQPFANHNGGMVEFGPDGFLYIGMGDGGSANDPGNRAQNINELLGKILRIDVDHPSGGLAYGIPANNPFADDPAGTPTPGRDEIYAVGLRNPWRFSFDRSTGQLYVGDVGQGAAEEIDIVTLGGNYGWRIWEGSGCTGNDPGLCSPAGFVFPIAQYGHTAGRCSVTGGYVYRGSQSTLPVGTYVYGDFCTGEIFMLQGGTSSVALDTGLSISSFGEDESGEIYVVGLGGTVHRLTGTVSCTFSLSPTSRSVPAAGIQGATAGVAAPVGCGWAATSNAAWITITSGQSGSGNGQVVFSASSNQANPTQRTGTLTVAGLTFTVTQGGCTFSLSPISRSVPVAGIQGAGVGVNAAPGCAWTAASNDAWITITSGQSGSGNGKVRFSVASNVGGASPRTGTLTVGGRTFTVTQGGCTYSLGSTSRSVAVGGIQGAGVGVNAPPGCGWTATSNAAWITIASGQSGSGNGQVMFTVASNQASTVPRTETLSIAGRTFTVTQAACTYALGRSSRSVAVGGVHGAVVGVSAPAGCGWTATSNAAWITITSGQSGSGNGQVVFSVAPNQAGAGPRTGTMTIGGRTFTVTQSSP